MVTKVSPKHVSATLIQYLVLWGSESDYWMLERWLIKTLNKLDYYLKQVFNCFVALDLTIGISASAADFVIILDLEDLAIHNKLGFLYSPVNLSPIFALTGVNRSFIIALSYCLKAIETHEKRPGHVHQLKDALRRLGSSPGSKMRPYKGFPRCLHFINTLVCFHCYY